MKTTIRELLRILRAHRGKVEVPVLVSEGVEHIFVEKKDLICRLKGYSHSMDDLAPWYVSNCGDGYLTLDVQDHPWRATGTI